MTYKTLITGLYEAKSAASTSNQKKALRFALDWFLANEDDVREFLWDWEME